MKGIDSSKQLFNQPSGTREENKISGTVSSYDNHQNLAPPGVKNPTYFSRGPIANVPLSPSSQKQDGGTALFGDATRNLSVLNMKKSSARFLNPIGADPPKQMPHTNIDKYPKKEDSLLQMPP